MKLRLTSGKTLFVMSLIIGSAIIAQAFGQQGKEKDHDEKAKNLKVLDKNTSGEEIHNIMKEYSKSLGVRCNFCHVASVPVAPGERPKMDFVSDDKKEKTTAREMMKMTEAINKKYIGEMADKGLEKITCVTCHMGHTKPMVSVDSLPQMKK